MKKNKCLFPGSFDPFTNGHLEVVKKALKDFEEVHIVIMDNEEKTPHFNLESRLDIIKSLKLINVIVEYWSGWASDYCKENDITDIVRGYRNDADFIYEKEIESVYKKCWDKLKVTFYKTDNPVSSSEVKQKIKNNTDIRNYVPWKENYER